MVVGEEGMGAGCKEGGGGRGRERCQQDPTTRLPIITHILIGLLLFLFGITLVFTHSQTCSSLLMSSVFSFSALTLW